MGFKSRLQKIADWFQPTYKKIDKWDVPWLRDMCRKIWYVIDDEAKKKVYNFITYVHKTYGENIAKKLMQNLKDFIDGIIDTD